MASSWTDWQRVLATKGFVAYSNHYHTVYKQRFIRNQDYTDLIAEPLKDGHLSLSVVRFTDERLRTIVPKLPLYSEKSFINIYNSFKQIIQEWQSQS